MRLTDMNHSGTSQDAADVVRLPRAGLPMTSRHTGTRQFAVRQGIRPNEEEPSMDSSHISALQLNHAGIDRQIHEELTRPMPDAVVIQALKKRKLRLKEEISRF
jgi:hypothetical protein